MFQKIAIIAVAGLVAAASLSAGQIQLGGSTGLTSTYITSNGGSTGTSTLSNYDSTLFSGSTNSGTPPTPFTGYSNTPGTASTAGSTLVQGTVTFDMISQTGNDGNFWDLVGQTPQIKIPAGVFGVQTVWTMLNNAYGPNTANDTDVTFTFDNAANGSNAASLNTVTVDLVNGTEIRDAVDCTSGDVCTSLNFATSLASGATSVSTTVTGSGPASINVVSRNVYSSIYNGGSSSPYGGTSGNLVLDDVGFAFGNAFANQYLVSVLVSDNSGVAGTSTTGVSAVTLVTTGLTPAPEPSSVVLFIAGSGLIGLVRLQRKRAKQS
jgi:hypothetical protein